MTRLWRRRWQWAGTMATVATAVAWLWSGWYTAGIRYYHREAYEAGLACGGIELALGMRYQGVGIYGGFGYLPPRPHERDQRWKWAPRVESYLSGSLIVVPLWIPFLLIAVPTAWLWYRDRRKPSGSCPRSGYDLSGLTACPECGPK